MVRINIEIITARLIGFALEIKESKKILRNYKLPF
jgi:hypothetical protein